MLTSYLFDTYSARKMKSRSTGNAGRSVADSPHVSPTNLFLAAGDSSPEEIIRSVESGLYVTELMGFGVNPTTGDYSRGATGLWIENGELAYPVERDHHRRQPAADVQGHRSGRQRSRLPPQHRGADAQDRAS